MNTERNRSTPEAPEFFSGWKDIATYLGKGVRTVQRYEIELGLPVRRPAGKPRGSVVATRSELDAWVTASPIREAFHLTRMTPGGLTSAAHEIKNTVQEMRTLRHQMMDLRSEFRHSLQTLKESILELQGGVFPEEGRKSAIADSNLLEPNFKTKSILELLAADSKERKAS